MVGMYHPNGGIDYSKLGINIYGQDDDETASETTTTTTDPSDESFVDTRVDIGGIRIRAD